MIGIGSRKGGHRTYKNGRKYTPPLSTKDSYGRADADPAVLGSPELASDSVTKDGRKLEGWGNTGPKGLDHRPPFAGPALGLTCYRALCPAEADLAKIQVGMNASVISATVRMAVSSSSTDPIVPSVLDG
ncbi:hypothetical protein ABNQ38_08660 (plasmid) [Azospirillum sp. A29]